MRNGLPSPEGGPKILPPRRSRLAAKSQEQTQAKAQVLLIFHTALIKWQEGRGGAGDPEARRTVLACLDVGETSLGLTENTSSPAAQNKLRVVNLRLRFGSGWGLFAFAPSW